ncbi:MAG TPA: hypothetical protein VLL49_03800 [Anaerolineales bacterium]|nr:hypothetical protein [Anaerolineales bacterium]
MKQKTAGLLLVPMLFIAVACTAVAGTPPEAPSTPTSVPAVVAPTEILWFPPTETPAIAAAVTEPPTPERKPGVGELLVADNMTSSAYWNASDSGAAAAMVSERGLTVSARPGGPPVVALHRSAVFGDMMLEMTARPSLCRGRDAYGLVFRAPNELAFYRFVAVCDGLAAVERLSLGTPRVLQPPTATSDVPVGAPGEVRLGVWALDSEFRFFLNDRYQFSVIDTNYLAGGIGVFVEAHGDNPAVVTFSDLKVYRLAPLRSVATAAP